jgi:hypothetical protein
MDLLAFLDLLVHKKYRYTLTLRDENFLSLIKSNAVSKSFFHSDFKNLNMTLVKSAH